MTTTVTTTSRQTHNHRTWAVRWHAQTWTCCRRDMTVADGDIPPVGSVDDDGTPQPAATQCPGCGTLRAARWTIEEVA